MIAFNIQSRLGRFAERGSSRDRRMEGWRDGWEDLQLFRCLFSPGSVWDEPAQPTSSFHQADEASCFFIFRCVSIKIKGKEKAAIRQNDEFLSEKEEGEKS